MARQLLVWLACIILGIATTSVAAVEFTSILA